MKTKKIYTITCHNVYNYGASLQEYALLKHLNSLGFDTKTINYTPDYLSGHFNFLSVDNPRFNKNILLKLIYIILKFPFKLLLYPKKLAFDKFSKEFIPETKTNYKSHKALKEKIPEADIYITGSDQVWNSYFQNGKDPAFYLNFVPEEKIKMAYAPSFAIENIDDNIKEFVRNNVKQIDYISVRESSGKSILNELNIESTVVLDPVFLLTKQEWEKISSKKLEDNYIFIYDFDSNTLIKKMALALKEKYNWKIIAINQNIKYADKNYFLKGPKEFLSLISNANIILSNSFHALAFSLIFNKNFLIFNRNTKINTRMRDLLLLLDLKNKNITNNNFNIENISSYLNINYIEINNKLDVLIKKSKQFLTNALNDK